MAYYRRKQTLEELAREVANKKTSNNESKRVGAASGGSYSSSNKGTSKQTTTKKITTTKPASSTGDWKSDFLSQKRSEQKADREKKAEQKKAVTEQKKLTNELWKDRRQNSAGFGRASWTKDEVKALNDRKETEKKESDRAGFGRASWTKAQVEALEKREASQKRQEELKAEQRKRRGQGLAQTSYKDDPQAQSYIDKANEGYNVVTAKLGSEKQAEDTGAIIPLLGSKDEQERKRYTPGDVTYLNEDERNQYSYILGKEGAEAANAYLEYVLPEANRRGSDAVMQEAFKYAYEHPVGGAAADILNAVPAGLQGIGMYANMLTRTQNDPNSPLFSRTHYMNEAREGLSTGLKDRAWAEEGSFAANAIDFATQTGLSIGESAARIATGGGAGSLALAAGGAGAGAYTDAIDRGATRGQAEMQAIFQGGAEAVFENLSLGGLKALAMQPVRGVKEFIKNLGRQMLTEGSEEAATEIANSISDKLIMGEASNFDEYRNQYLQAGYDEKEAIVKAFGDIGKNVLLAAAGGAISGGVMGGGVMGINTGLKNAYGRQSNLGKDVSFQEIADSIDVDPQSYTDAEGNINEEAVQKAEETKAYAQELADQEYAGTPVNNLQKADLEAEVYQLAQQAVETRGTEEFDITPQEETAQTNETVESPVQETENPQLMRLAEDMAGVNDGFEQVPEGATRVQAMPIEVGSRNAAEQETAARTQWQTILTRPDFEGMQFQEDGDVTTIERLPDGNYAMNTIMQDGQQASRTFPGDQVGNGGDQDILYSMPYATQVRSVEADVYYGAPAAQMSPMEQTLAQQGYNLNVRKNDTQRSTWAPKRTEYTGPITGYVEQNATNLPESATNTMVSMYDGSVNMAQYITAFKRMYNAGRNNVPITAGQQSVLRNYLTHDQMMAAYKAGAQDRNTAMEAQKAAGAEKSEQEGKRSGGIGKASKSSTQEQRKAAAIVGERTGLRINVSEETEGEAEYNAETGEITISPYSKNFNQSLTHELTHFLQDYAPKEYQKYKETVIEALMTAKGYGYDQAYEVYEAAYENVGVKDTDAITDEMVADATGMFWNDADFIDRIALENRSIAQKIRDFLADILTAIKQMISGEHITGVARSLYENEAKYRTALNLWTDALEKASTRYKDGAETAKGGSRYQLNEFGLEGYTEAELRSWAGNEKIVFCNTKQEVVDFVQWMLDRDLKVQRWAYLGKIGKQVAERIKNDTGIDVEGLKIVIDKQGLEHAFTHHSKKNNEEKLRGQVPVRAEMFADVPDIFASYDFIEKSNKSESAFVISKDINGVRTILAIANPNRHMVRVDDLWQRKKGLTKPTNTSSKDAASDVRNALGHGPSEDNISRSEMKIKHQLDIGEPVEQTKNLIAVHNLDAKKLNSVLDLGGFVMPSIAITRADLGHSNFGDISVIFRKDSISPTDRRNKIYSADAYTTRMPMAQYEYDGKQLKKLADKLGESESYVRSNYLEGSADRVARNLEDSIPMQEYYAKTIGEELPDDYYDRRDRAKEIAGFNPKSGEYGSEYKTFVQNELDQIVKGRGFYKSDVDPYYPDGREKSWKQMHVAFDPEAALKLMLKQKGRNQEGGFGITANQLRAAVSKQYKSIDELHRNEGRLQISEDAEEQLEALNDRVYELARDIAEDYSDMDSAAEAMINAGKKPDTLNRELAKYSLEATEDQLQEYKDIIQEIKEVPVRYFEAKPERVLNFDEVAAVVIPDDTSEKLKSRIMEEGMPVYEYAAGDKEARSKVIRNIDNIRFQLEVDDNSAQTENLVRSNRNLQNMNTYLTSQLASKSNWMPNKTDIRNTARQLIKDTGSYISEKQLTERLTTFYNWIHNSDYIDGEEASAIAADIAADLVMHSESEYDKDQMRMFNDLKRYLRATRIKLDKSYNSELSQYGGYNEFRKKYFGVINLSKDGTAVDQLYPELHDRFPEYFPDTILNQADQLIRIADVVDSLRPRPTVNQELEGAAFDEATYMIGQQIFDSYFNVRYEAGKNDYRQQYAESIRNYKKQLREDYNRKLHEQYQKANEKRKEIKDKYEKASKEQKEKYRKQLDDLRNFKNSRLYAQQEMYLERVDKTRDFYRGHKYKDMIRKDAAEMTRWLLNPNDKKHVPESLRAPLAEFLSQIDFRGNQYNQQGEITQRWALWQELQGAYASIVAKGGIVETEEGTQFYELDDDLIEKMAELNKAVKDGISMDEMTSYQLRTLKDVVRAMKKTIVDANKMISNKRFERIQDLANETAIEMSGYKDKQESANRAVRAMDKLLNNSMLDSFTRFRTFGKAAYSVYEELREGFNKKIRRVKEAQDYFQNLIQENGITQKDLKKWSGLNADSITITTAKGAKLEMKVSQAMSLYELLKRDQAKKHIFEGGIKLAETKIRKKEGKRSRVIISKSIRPVEITAADALKIVNKLTNEQKKIADGISNFFVKNTSIWGNEASMMLYGYEKFNAKNYFPIVVDRNSVTTKDNEISGGTQILRNIGMTKATTPKASNPLMIEDIFDVYTRQVDQMSSYNAFVVPLSDMQKWLNYRGGEEGQINIKSSIETAYGKEAVQYVRQLMEDINGVGSNDRYFARDLIGRFKAAKVGANLRVVIQQPTSYMRVMNEMDPKYMAKAMLKSEKGVWEIVQKHSPIALWKDWGYFETQVGKSMKQILIGPESRLDQLRDLQMAPAGWGDKITWAKIWQACELETRDKYKKLTPGTDEFYKKVAERFDEIIDATQVVDSVLHRTQMMRSEDGLTQMATSFMSEPMKNFNMLYRAAFDFINGTGEDKKEAGKKLIRAITTFAISGAATAAVSAIISAMRDDDKEKTYGEKYVDAVLEDFTANVNPLGMIPFVRDMMSIMEGYDVSRTDMEAFQEFWWAVTKIYKFVKARVSGEETKETIPYMILYAMKPVSSFTGIAFDNAVRDAEGIIDTMLQGFGLDEAEYQKTRILDSNISAKANTKTYVQMAIRAYMDGDEDLGDQIIADLKEAGIEDDKINQQLSSMLSDDERIQEAAEARVGGNTDEYNDIVQELVGEGFSEEIVESKVKSTIDKLNPYSYADIEEEVDKITGSSSGDMKLANDMIEEFAGYQVAKNGWTDKDVRKNIRSQLTGYFKPLYIAGDANTRSLILRKLRMLKYKGENIYDDDKDIIAWGK